MPASVRIGLIDGDFVVEGTDNFASKYLVNDACVMLGKGFTIGGINRFHGQVIASSITT